MFSLFSTRTTLLKIQTVSKLLFFFTLISVTTIAFLPNYNFLPKVVSISDLFNHALAFTVLYLFLAGTYPALSFLKRISFLLFLAAGIEVVQYFLPTRDASWSDITADMAGLLIGYLIIVTMIKLHRKKAVAFL